MEVLLILGFIMFISYMEFSPAALKKREEELYKRTVEDVNWNRDK